MLTSDLILETICQMDRPPRYWPFHKYWFVQHRWYYLERILNNFSMNSLMGTIVQLPSLICGVRKLGESFGLLVKFDNSQDQKGIRLFSILDEQVKRNVQSSILFSIFPNYDYQPTLHLVKEDHYLILDIPPQIKIQERTLDELEDRFIYDPMIKLNGVRRWAEEEKWLLHYTLIT
ncbi:MAG: hypothetical protein ACYCQJ_14550 [Nitrososphaerales archaeon]